MDTLSLVENFKKIVHQARNRGLGPVFGGVHSYEEIREFIHANSNIAFIFNEDPEGEPGTHWQCFWIPEAKEPNENRTCYFFDSFGRHPTNPFIREYINEITKTIVWKEQQLQSYDSAYCGAYCSVFLWEMVSGMSFDEFYERSGQFGNDFKQNDQLISCVYQNHFKTTLSRKPIQICRSYNNYKKLLNQ